MRTLMVPACVAGLMAVAGCAPSAEQLAAQAAAQHAADQNRCFGYGFQPGTDNFAHCMMSTAWQRDAQQAADRRMAAAQAAANQRQQAAIQATKDAAEKDAWDRTTHQGAYAYSASSSAPAAPPPPAPPSTNPVDAVRDQIQNDIDKIQNAGVNP